MRVTVSILNWNCERFLVGCIDSVLKQTYPGIDLLLIDNDSTDNSLSLVKSKYPGITVLKNSANLGFARAHNIAIRESDNRYYMPLNPDVVLTTDCISELVAVMEEERSNRVGSASAKIYFSDDNGNPSRRLYSTGHLLTRNRKPSNRGYKQEDTGRHEDKEYIFGVNGACPLLSKEMLEDVAVDGQYFDETFFLYGDDYDLGWRAQLLGWKSIYVPQAIAYHYGKGSGGLNTPYIQFQYARNRYIEIYKNELTRHFLMDLPFILSYEFMWQAYTLLTNPRRTIAHVRAVTDFLLRIPETHEKRRKVQSRRKVSYQYMRSITSGPRVR